jgi:hypothetical protein
VTATSSLSLAAHRLAGRPGLVFGAAASLSVAAYLGFSAQGGYVGFPLDDAWIHQTYARNLATLGQFAFIPGQPSAGSTAPLWTLLLSLGYLSHLEYHVWTYALGVVLLAANAWLVYRLVLRLWPAARSAALAAGLLVCMEWHLAWSAVSGMETLLFSALALATFVFEWPSQAGLIGLAAGLAVLARPDGLSLLSLIALRAVLSRERSWRALGLATLGFAVLFLPYLLLNYRLSGTPWPNTFYAKQAEYAVLRDQPLVSRLLTISALPFIGPLVLLLPTMVVMGVRSARARQWETLMPLAWCLAEIGAYALRLPVTYQYGRYVMPTIPALAALGVGGLSQTVRPSSTQLLARAGSRAWLATVVVLALAFWWIGAVRYRTDVRIIQTEMVAAAEWVRTQTPPGSLVAAHDIGALGYFGGRPILDLAGLVSPEVIPFIRDQDQLATWLSARGARYLMTFPNWYPRLTPMVQDQLLFDTHAPYAPADGGENMAIYAWPPAAP